MIPHHLTEDDSPHGEPVIGKKGITIPWAWLMGCAPLFAMGGAIGHAQVFGAPPEFEKRMEMHQSTLSDHERRIVELDKFSARAGDAQERTAKDVARILNILEHRP